MPEGDSLARVERALRPILAGQALTGSDFRVPTLATLDLTGRVVTDVSAYGKHLFMQVEGGDVIHSHLLMEGRWLTLPAGARWPVAPSRVRVALSTASHQVLGVQLGVLEALTPAQRESLVASLGPDPIHAWDAARALTLLRARPERQLGAALLDQRVVAGIGNIFRAESLFVARLNPFSTVGEHDDAALARVLDVAAQQLQENAPRSSRRTAGPTWRERYWVYGRAGKPCPRGHGLVAQAPLADPDLGIGRVGGDASDLSAVARDAFWCPRCQPGPDPREPGAEKREPRPPAGRPDAPDAPDAPATPATPGGASRGRPRGPRPRR